MKPTLVVLAAGIGSRYGGLKQMDRRRPVRRDHHRLLHLRRPAGRASGKVVFVIRRSIEAEFREVFLGKLGGKIDVDYVFQELNDLPAGFPCPPGPAASPGARPTPCLRPLPRSGSRSPSSTPTISTAGTRFERWPASWSGVRPTPSTPSSATVCGPPSRSTASVARGVCEVDGAGYLSGIVERTQIEQDPEGIVYHHADGRTTPPSGRDRLHEFLGLHALLFRIAPPRASPVSWGRLHNPKAEMYIPLVINSLIIPREATVKVLPTARDAWFGVTYKEDRPRVMAELEKLVAAGEYPPVVVALKTASFPISQGRAFRLTRASPLLHIIDC